MSTRIIAATVVLLVACAPPAARTQTAQLPTATLDQLLAPIALYPDSLLAQMLMSASRSRENHRARQVAEEQCRS